MFSAALEQRDVARARIYLAGLRGRSLDERAIARAAADLAALLWEAARAGRTAAERNEAELLARLMLDPAGQAFSNLVADRAFRSADPARVVAAVLHLLDRLGVPRYLPVADRLALGGVRAVGPSLPRAVARSTLARLRERTRSVLLSAAEPDFSRHVAERRRAGVRLNLNWLGEAVLGEAEADRRLAQYLQLLGRDDVEAISVKASTLTSQLRPFAFEATLDRLRSRLRALYRAARDARAGGGRPGAPKLVNLDMEAYRDLELTVALFRSVLDEPEFRGLEAGIALQAYLPDSFAIQQRLTDWAIARVAAGGAPIRIRVVKGANLAAEVVESSLRGWEVPVYATKAEVDANARRMVSYAIEPGRVAAVHLGLATHNVFDLAHGMVLCAARGIATGVSFELLEGMADPLRRVVQALAGEVLLYGPVVDDGAMQSAIAYLIRRLDENTAPDNFLRHGFGMEVGDGAWVEQRERFWRACADQERVGTAPRRASARGDVAMTSADAPFRNEPDSDFTLGARRDRFRKGLATVRDGPLFEVPLGIAGELRLNGPLANGFDPSRPSVIPYHYAQATAGDVEDALRAAVRARAGWAERGWEDRVALLGRVAERLRQQRVGLVAAMVLDAGKRVEEADAEVSEAVDFAEYYRRSCRALAADGAVRAVPKGVVLVASPWNFPLAIPAGGVFAALLAGNAVILKPASETPWVGYLLARACWDAGIPQDVLQLVLATDEVASRLVTDPRVDAVVLTGGTATAQLFQDLRPGLDLMAETGGKNAMIVSALADRDLAIAHAVSSAFGHAGQKCSATSLLVCEAEVYDDPAFLRSLRDAAASLPLGSAWEPDSFVTPLIHPPRGPLLTAMTALSPGEQWLLEPRGAPGNPRLWSPGIKLVSQEGSAAHVTELFGPVLAVMRAESLDDALRIANATPFGLTAALQSLDERDQLQFLDGMRAGNLYVNRGTTGALVGRQPFGGYKASCFGPGAKAGGPNYVAQLVRLGDGAVPRAPAGTPLLPGVERLLELLQARLPDHSWARLREAARSYAAALEEHYGVDHPTGEVIGQVNVLAYRMLDGLLVRVAEDAAALDVALVCAAALTCLDAVELSVDPLAAARIPWVAEVPGVRTRIESAGAAAERVSRLGAGLARGGSGPERLRVVGTPEAELVRAAAFAGLHAACEPPLRHGRWELRHYVREQSICIDTHRYGNLAPAGLAPLGASSPAHPESAGDGRSDRDAG